MLSDPEGGVDVSSVRCVECDGSDVHLLGFSEASDPHLLELQKRIEALADRVSELETEIYELDPSDEEDTH